MVRKLQLGNGRGNVSFVRMKEIRITPRNIIDAKKTAYNKKNKNRTIDKMFENEFHTEGFFGRDKKKNNIPLISITMEVSIRVTKELPGGGIPPFESGVGEGIKIVGVGITAIVGVGERAVVGSIVGTMVADGVAGWFT